MKNQIIYTTILIALLSLITLYSYGTSSEPIRISATEQIALIEEDYINIKQLNDSVYMVYCPNDTLYVEVNTYEDELFKISVVLDRLNCISR